MEPAVEVRQRAREQQEKGVGLGRQVPWPRDSSICQAVLRQGKLSPLSKEVWAQNRVPLSRPQAVKAGSNLMYKL